MIPENINYFIFIGIGFFSTFISIIFLRALAFKLRLIDVPDARKQHKGDIPLIGGICIYVGIIIYFFYVDKLNPSIEMILVSSFFILILGVYDDFTNLKPKLKLFFQLVLVALTIYISGIKIESLGFLFGLHYPLNLGLLAVPFSIISVVGLINAFNMIDGIDGQAGFLSIIAIIGIFIFGLEQVGSDLYEILLVISSGLISFLFFNFLSINKMKIFLGDAGSLFLGFIISFTLIYCSQILKIFSPSFALWCVAIPLFDFFSVVILRKIYKEKLIISNRDHIHHFLETFNLSRKFISFLTGFIGFVFLFLGYYLEVNFPTFSFWIFVITFLLYLSTRFYFKIKNKE